MEENKYFKEALQRMTRELAIGGAVRHLAKKYACVSEIMGHLDYPAPRTVVEDAVWEYYLEEKILLLEEPGQKKEEGRVRYVKEWNAYGKTSFRRVVEEIDNPISFEKWDVKEKGFPAFGEIEKRLGNSYVEVPFAKHRKLFSECYPKAAQNLSEELCQMVEEIPWCRKAMGKAVFWRVSKDSYEISRALFAAEEWMSCFYLVHN